MQLISLKFAFFWLVVLILYYVFPHFQWQILLAASILFYRLCGGTFPFVICVCAGAIWGLGFIRDGGRQRIVKNLLLLLFAILFVLCKLGGTLCLGTSLRIPVGVSFFLLAAAGYCMDICWERYRPEKNYAKLVLFLAFFPSRSPNESVNCISASDL